MSLPEFSIITKVILCGVESTEKPNLQSKFGSLEKDGGFIKKLSPYFSYTI